MDQPGPGPTGVSQILFGEPLVGAGNPLLVSLPDGSIRIFEEPLLTAADVLSHYPHHDLSLSPSCARHLPPDTTLLPWNTYYLHLRPGTHPLNPLDLTQHLSVHASSLQGHNAPRRDSPLPSLSATTPSRDSALHTIKLPPQDVSLEVPRTPPRNSPLQCLGTPSPKSPLLTPQDSALPSRPLPRMQRRRRVLSCPFFPPEFLWKEAPASHQNRPLPEMPTPPAAPINCSCQGPAPSLPLPPLRAGCHAPAPHSLPSSGSSLPSGFQASSLTNVTGPWFDSCPLTLLPGLPNAASDRASGLQMEDPAHHPDSGIQSPEDCELPGESWDRSVLGRCSCLRTNAPPSHLVQGIHHPRNLGRPHSAQERPLASTDARVASPLLRTSANGGGPRFAPRLRKSQSCTAADDAGAAPAGTCLQTQLGQHQEAQERTPQGILVPTRRSMMHGYQQQQQQQSGVRNAIMDEILSQESGVLDQMSGSTIFRHLQGSNRGSPPLGCQEQLCGGDQVDGCGSKGSQPMLGHRQLLEREDSRGEADLIGVRGAQPFTTWSRAQEWQPRRRLQEWQSRRRMELLQELYMLEAEVHGCGGRRADGPAEANGLCRCRPSAGAVRAAGCHAYHVHQTCQMPPGAGAVHLDRQLC